MVKKSLKLDEKTKKKTRKVDWYKSPKLDEKMKKKINHFLFDVIAYRGWKISKIWLKNGEENLILIENRDKTFRRSKSKAWAWYQNLKLEKI